MFLWAFLFLVFIIILWQSSNQVLVKVKRIARSFGISEIAVTLLALSVLASFPEFLVSVFAALKQNSDVSLGTVVGSNIFTLLVVLGLAAFIRPFHVKMVIEERDSVWMLLSSSVLLIFVPRGISRWEGVLLILLYFPYIYSVYLTWIIHESRLLQMQGVVHEAVVFHRKWATTQQMRQDRLARR